MKKRKIAVRENHSARTFTLRFVYEDGTRIKYRTTRMNKDEFRSCLNNTQNDWEIFLKSNDYYPV